MYPKTKSVHQCFKTLFILPLTLGLLKFYFESIESISWFEFFLLFFLWVHSLWNNQRSWKVDSQGKEDGEQRARRYLACGFVLSWQGWPYWVTWSATPPLCGPVLPPDSLSLLSLAQASSVTWCFMYHHNSCLELELRGKCVCPPYTRSQKLKKIQLILVMLYWSCTNKNVLCH